MNSKLLFDDFVKQIQLPYGKDEVKALCFILFEDLLHLTKQEILAQKEISLDQSLKEKVSKAVDQLNNHEPVQYITGNAMFYGRKLHVNQSVLIPRPETEELVYHIIQKVKSRNSLHIVDIGTGSGCIPISLSLELKSAKIFATDVSEDALLVARDNASTLQANITFIKHDILNSDLPLQNVDVVVSNPPYIALNEKSQMHDNVVKFEPHLALFVFDDDPLLFYKAIVNQAKKILNPDGIVAFEINERFGKAVASLFSSEYFHHIEIIKDINNKERIVMAVRHS